MTTRRDIVDLVFAEHRNETTTDIPQSLSMVGRNINASNKNRVLAGTTHCSGMVTAVSSWIRSTGPKKNAQLGTLGPPTDPPNCCRLNGSLSNPSRFVK
jgi:hypothetical protein